MRDSIVFYKTWGELIASLPMDKGSLLMLMIFDYAFNDIEDTSDDPTIDALFNLIKGQLDRDAEKWDEIRRKRSEAGIKGNEIRWHNRKTSQSDTSYRKSSQTDVCESQNIANIAVNVNDNVNVNVKEKESIKEKDSSAMCRRFTPPTLQEVADYVNSKGYSVDPQAFIDFYESKGWYIGKNKMKSWQSAVGTWERRQKRDRKPNSFKEFKQNTYDYEALESKIIANK